MDAERAELEPEAVDAARATVRVVLDDGSELPQPGRLLFSDLSVDPSSGQITLRAELGITFYIK